MGLRQVYFVGQDDRGLVTLYRGVPYELPLGIDLYDPVYVSAVPARTLTAQQRRRDPRPPAALARRRRRHRAAAREGQRVTARNRELMGLIPVSLLVTAGFTAVFAARQSEVGNASLTYGAIFLGLCLVVHLFIRATLPHADPYLFPLCALLAAFGLVVVYRIDEALARQQAGWFVAGIALFALTVLLLRDVRVLERYRYVIAAAGIGLLMLPRLPGIGAQVNGAYLGVDIGPAQLPADGVREALHRRLPRELPERARGGDGGGVAPRARG